MTVDDFHTYFVSDLGIWVHNTNGGLSTAQQATINKLQNTIKDHLTEMDFSGMLRDVKGNPVPKPGGGFWDHLGEMKDSLKGLQGAKRSLEGSLKNPNLDSFTRKILQANLNQASYYINTVSTIFKKYGVS